MNVNARKLVSVLDKILVVLTFSRCHYFHVHKSYKASTFNQNSRTMHYLLSCTLIYKSHEFSKVQRYLKDPSATLRKLVKPQLVHVKDSQPNREERVIETPDQILKLSFHWRYVPTRWNSSYQMMLSDLERGPTIHHILTKIGKRHMILSNEEVVILENSIKMLGQFNNLAPKLYKDEACSLFKTVSSKSCEWRGSQQSLYCLPFSKLAAVFDT